MDGNEELMAIYAAARSQQAAAAKAVAELEQLVAANRAIPGQVAQEAGRAQKAAAQVVQQTVAQALERIEKGADEAVRKAAVNDVGPKIRGAMERYGYVIEDAVRNLKDSAQHAESAAANWRSFTRFFRWSQLAVALIVGMAIGSVATWYYGLRSVREMMTESLSYQQRVVSSSDDSRVAVPVSPAKRIQRTAKPAQKPSSQSRFTAEPEEAAPQQ